MQVKPSSGLDTITKNSLKRGTPFHKMHSEAFLKKYETDIREIARRAEKGVMPSLRKIAEYMTVTHGEDVGMNTVAKHLELIKKGLPLWEN